MNYARTKEPRGRQGRDEEQVYAIPEPWGEGKRWRGNLPPGDGFQTPTETVRDVHGAVFEIHDTEDLEDYCTKMEIIANSLGSVLHHETEWIERHQMWKVMMIWQESFVEPAEQARRKRVNIGR